MAGIHTYPDFGTFWIDVQRQFDVGSAIRNWTAFGGYLGDRFIVAKRRPGYIEISTPQARTIQHITQSEFEKVYEVWNDYVKRKMPRHRLAKLTRFSKYIISIIRELEIRD
jgi:hypothetical protein